MEKPSEVAVAKIGIINVSDRASAGVYEDIPGKAIVETLELFLVSPWEKEYRIVPDEQDQLAEIMVEMSDVIGCCLIVTSGGTGPAVRDVTPEATNNVCNNMS